MFSSEPVRRGCEAFLRVVSSLNDLPEVIQQAIQKYQPTDSIRKIVYIPPQQYPLRHIVWRYKLAFGWRYTPPRILVFGTNQITIIEGLEAQNILPIPLTDMLTIRLVSVLLYNYFELEWLSGTQIQTVRVEFNAVGMHHIEKELNYARTWIAAKTPPPIANPAPEFSIRHFPLKFYNYTHLSLLPGEQIWAGVYEPGIKAAGRLGGSLSPNRSVVITDQYMILVSDQYSREPLAASYLIDRWFCPREQITQAAFETQSDIVWLNISLGHADYDFRMPLREPQAVQLQAAMERWLIKVYIPAA